MNVSCSSFVQRPVLGTMSSSSSSTGWLAPSLMGPKDHASEATEAALRTGTSFIGTGLDCGLELWKANGSASPVVYPPVE